MAMQKNWRPEAVMLLLGGIITSGMLAGGVIGLLHHFRVAGFRSDDSFGNLLLATLSLHGVALAGLIPFLKYHDTDWRTLLGLDRPGLGGALALAGLSLLVIFPAVWGLQAASVATLTHFHYPAEDQAAVVMLLNAPSAVTRVYLIIFAVVIAPVAEEFIFRGILFPFLKQAGWPRLAWVLPSFLFALVHVSVPIFVPLFVLALGLTWLYATTGRLLANIFVHSVFNAVNVVILLVTNHSDALPHDRI